MEWQALKDKMIYEKVNNGNIQQISALRSSGADLEWRDSEGKTPLILACVRHDLLDSAKVLIELGANVNVYRAGKNGGTPLHHAAIKGHDQAINVLLSNGANPFIRNDDGRTALELAREKGRFIVVRAIENYIKFFSGWLRAECGSVLNGSLKPISSDFRPGKVWAVVLLCDNQSPNLMFELAIYLAPEVAEPWEVIPLWESHIEYSDLNETDPYVIIESTGTRYKLSSDYKGEKQQIKFFYNACRGISQANNTIQSTVTVPVPVQNPPSRFISPPSVPVIPNQIPVPTDTEDLDLALAIKASIQTAIAEGVPLDPTDFIELNPTRTNPRITIEPDSQPSIIEETFYDAHIDHPLVSKRKEDREYQDGTNCVICMDAKVEGACIPCGHMAGCMSCLKKVEAKNKKCPVCRAKVELVVKIYTV